MLNKNFLKTLTNSFKTYLKTGSRSNEKLKILHGQIAKDISLILGKDYKIHSLGFEDGKEIKIQGRYINKAVDLTIKYKNEIVAGIAVKYVMSNYSQNSNNYFENMLGETANIKCSKIPYFQILILPNELPYYKSNGKISKIEKITENNLNKYMILSKDNENIYFHTPTKTLLCLIKMPEFDIKKITNKKEYNKKFLNLEIKNFEEINSKFGKNVILNDYAKFIEKITHYIKSL